MWVSQRIVIYINWFPVRSQMAHKNNRLVQQFRSFEPNASIKPLTLPITEDQPWSILLWLPGELLSSIILLVDIYSIFSTRLACKQLFSLLDLDVEVKIYLSNLQHARQKNDRRSANELSTWYPATLKQRAFCFNSVPHLSAYLRVLNKQPTPANWLALICNPVDEFKRIKRYNADTIVDYFMSHFADCDNYALMKNEGFQIMLWRLLVLYSNNINFEYDEESLQSKAFQRVMHYVSKYSFVLIRLLMSNNWGPTFPSIGHRPRVLATLLQLQHMYPLDLTGQFPNAETLAYKLSPLELSCHTRDYDVFKVLVEHTPLVPHASYIAVLTDSRTPRNLDFLIDLLARGADINAPLNPLLRNHHRNAALESPLALACMKAVQGASQYRCVVDVLLAHGAQFSAHDVTVIRELPLQAQIEPVFNAVAKGNYNPFSAPVSEWHLEGLTFSSIHSGSVFSVLEIEEGGAAQYRTNQVYNSANYEGYWSRSAEGMLVCNVAHDVCVSLGLKYLVYRTCLGSYILLPESESNQTMDQKFMEMIAN